MYVCCRPDTYIVKNVYCIGKGNKTLIFMIKPYIWNIYPYDDKLFNV